MPVQRSNPKSFEILLGRLQELDGKTLKVGWFEGNKYENGTPVAYAAALNEYGHGATPPRPFARPMIAKKQQEIKETAAKLSGRVLTGEETADSAMNLLGLKVQGDLVESIADVNSPALSPITLVARKYRREGKQVTGKTIGEIAALIKDGKMPDVSGVSSKPLNDSGVMIATATYEVD